MKRRKPKYFEENMEESFVRCKIEDLFKILILESQEILNDEFISFKKSENPRVTSKNSIKSDKNIKRQNISKNSKSHSSNSSKSHESSLEKSPKKSRNFTNSSKNDKSHHSKNLKSSSSNINSDDLSSPSKGSLINYINTIDSDETYFNKERLNQYNELLQPFYNKSYGKTIISDMLSLSKKIAEYQGNEGIRRTLHKMQENLTHYREIKGDGNCFYRATYFLYIERVILKIHSENDLKQKDIYRAITLLLDEEIELIECDIDENTESYKYKGNLLKKTLFMKKLIITYICKLILYRLSHINDNKDFSTYFLKQINENPALDIALIVYMRTLALKAYRNIREEKNFEGFFTEDYGKLIQEYDVEGESMILNLMAESLYVNMNIQGVDDKQKGEKMLYCSVITPLRDRGDDIDTLYYYFRPGHYDCFYTKTEMGEMEKGKENEDFNRKKSEGNIEKNEDFHQKKGNFEKNEDFHQKKSQRNISEKNEDFQKSEGNFEKNEDFHEENSKGDKYKKAEYPSLGSNEGIFGNIEENKKKKQKICSKCNFSYEEDEMVFMQVEKCGHIFCYICMSEMNDRCKKENIKGAWCPLDGNQICKINDLKKFIQGKFPQKINKFPQGKKKNCFSFFQKKK